MPQLRMTLTRAGALGLVALLVTACPGERAAPLAPNTEPAPDPAAAQMAIACLRLVPMPQNVTVSATITADGGSLEIKEAGLKLDVPPGAVVEPTTITVTALAGRAVAYEFGPSGSRFLVPLAVQQSLRGLDWYDVPRPARYEAAYLADMSQLDATRGEAVVNEFLPLTWDYLGSKMRFNVSHFSGYMISTGRVDQGGR